MVVSLQYPHKLHASYQGIDAIKDGNGDWTQAESGVIIADMNCRIQPNSKGTTIEGINGEKVVFDSIIYVEGRIETIPYGANIEVKEGEEVILSATLLRFSRDSFHSRLWV